MKRALVLLAVCALLVLGALCWLAQELSLPNLGSARPQVKPCPYAQGAAGRREPSSTLRLSLSWD